MEQLNKIKWIKCYGIVKCQAEGWCQAAKTEWCNLLQITVEEAQCLIDCLVAAKTA